MGRHHLRPLPIAVLLAVLLTLSSAWAGKPEVAVLDFKGKDADRIERRVRKIVSSRATLVKARRYQRVAKRIKAPSTSSDDIAEVAERMDLDAVIYASTVKAKGKRFVKIRVRDADGKLIDRFKVRARSRALGSKARRQLRKRLSRALSEAEASTRELRSKRRLADKRASAKKRRRAAKLEKIERRRTQKRARAQRRLAKKREQAKQKRAQEREREIRLAAQARKAKRAARRRKRIEREERAMAARAKAKYDTSGQAIDEEKPPGL